MTTGHLGLGGGLRADMVLGGWNSVRRGPFGTRRSSSATYGYQADPRQILGHVEKPRRETGANLAGLLQIAHVVDSDHVFGRILYWLVPCDVGGSHDILLSI